MELLSLTFFENQPTRSSLPHTGLTLMKLLDYCRELIKQFENQEFPTEEWLRKRGKWKDRDGEAYNTLSIYIKTWLGGIRKAEKNIRQESVSTKVWDKEIAMDDLKRWFREIWLHSWKRCCKI